MLGFKHTWKGSKVWVQLSTWTAFIVESIVRAGHKPLFNIIAADSSATAARVRCLSPRLASRNRTFQPPSTPSHPPMYTLNSNGGAFTVLLINWVQPNSLALDFGFITFYSYLKRAFFYCSWWALMVLMFYGCRL